MVVSTHPSEVNTPFSQSLFPVGVSVAVQVQGVRNKPTDITRVAASRSLKKGQIAGHGFMWQNLNIGVY